MRGGRSVCSAAPLALLVAGSVVALLGPVAMMDATAAPAALGASAFAPVETELTATTPIKEQRLVRGLVSMRQGRLDEAIREVRDLVREQPDFRLAQIVFGDLMVAQSGRLSSFANGSAHQDVSGYREEARARLLRYLEAPPPDAVPASLLQLPTSAPAAVVVDLETYRLYLFRNVGGGIRLSSDYYVSIGRAGADKEREGDEKTPVGVYLVSSFLPDETLPDMYGVGAFPITYPNLWDRRLGRTGSGIWIHGTDLDRYSRSPQSSRGCVTLSNEDFEVFKDWVEVGKTEVVVADGLRWIDRDEARRQRAVLQGAVERWRADWESRDAERYLSHYSAEFSTRRMSREAFAAHKRRVNPSKAFIRIDLEDVGIYGYPGEENLALVTFVQRYRSDNFQGVKRKHQYWRREGGSWRIVMEDAV